MKQTSVNKGRKDVTRRGFLKTLLPGLFAAGVVAAAGTSQPPANTTYGNGPYGGRASDTK